MLETSQDLHQQTGYQGAKRGPVLLGAGLSILLLWPWLLSLLFYWGNSIQGVGASLCLMVALSGVLNWRLGVLVGAACALALGQGLLAPASRARQEWLFCSKRQQIRDRRLAFSPQWGWIDRRHGLSDVLQQLVPGGQRTLAHTFFGSWGHYYQLNVRVRLEDRHQAWSALRQIGEACEAQEAILPWYTAARLSAYNPDDLPSLYWTIFAQAHPYVDWKFLNAEESERLWNQQGREVVQKRVRQWRDFTPVDVNLRTKYRILFEQLEPVQVEYWVEGPLRL